MRRSVYQGYELGKDNSVGATESISLHKIKLVEKFSSVGFPYIKR